jgi:hypothetical protein
VIILSHTIFNAYPGRIIYGIRRCLRITVALSRRWRDNVLIVIPAEAGIQCSRPFLDPGFRRGGDGRDGYTENLTFARLPTVDEVVRSQSPDGFARSAKIKARKP